MYLLTVTLDVLLLLVACKSLHASTAPKRFNITELMAEIFSTPEYRKETSADRDDSPITRDTSYLPETDYFEEYEVEQTDNQLGRMDRPDRNLLPEYRNLCEIFTRKVQMNDAEYEYQPPHYHEVFCKSYSIFDQSPRVPAKPARQKCAHPGFHCVQRSRTLFMVRRLWEGECWEPFTKEIASGCDCMWPVSSLGDISAHY